MTAKVVFLWKKIGWYIILMYKNPIHEREILLQGRIQRSFRKLEETGLIHPWVTTTGRVYSWYLLQKYGLIYLRVTLAGWVYSMTLKDKLNPFLSHTDRTSLLWYLLGLIHTRVFLTVEIYSRYIKTEMI